MLPDKSGHSGIKLTYSQIKILRAQRRKSLTSWLALRWTVFIINWNQWVFQNLFLYLHIINFWDCLQFWEISIWFRSTWIIFHYIVKYSKIKIPSSTKLLSFKNFLLLFIGFAKKFVRIFPYQCTENSEQTFWPTHLFFKLLLANFGRPKTNK